MVIFPSIDFKGISNLKADLEKKYTNAGEKGKLGGFLSPNLEREFKFTMNYYKKHIENSSLSHIVNLRTEALKTGGDITKINSKVASVLKSNYDKSKEFLNKYKSNKNISENSLVKAYVDIYEHLHDSKAKAAYKKAFDELKKKKKDTKTAGCIEVLYFLYIIMLVSAMVLCIVAIFYIIGDCISGFSNVSEKNVEEKLSKSARENSGAKSVIVTALHGIYFMKSLKDPVKEIDKAVKAEEKVINDIKKGKEGLNSEFYIKKEKRVDFTKLSRETWLVDRSNDRSQEDLVVGLLIAAGVIAGIVLLISLIRSAIYWIAANHVDYLKEIIEEEEMLKMNIAELQKQYDNENNPLVKEKLGKTIAKQQQWLNKFEMQTYEYKKDMETASYNMNDEITSEDSSNYTDDDFQVVL
jgi:uncharacterized membrane protein (DUF485 family)